jgi:hypothetical protein
MDMMENGTSDAEIVQGATAPVRSTATLAGIALEAMSAMRSQHDEQAADSDGRDSREITQRIEVFWFNCFLWFWSGSFFGFGRGAC